VPRHQVIGTEVEHQAEARDPLVHRTQACAANRIEGREGLVEVVAQVTMSIKSRATAALASW
jgi:hypothetical protein